MQNEESAVEPSPTETDREGRLIAHRLVIEMLIEEVARLQGDTEAFWTRFEDYFQVQDHQEDPGALPDRAFGIEAASSAEIRRLVTTVRRRCRGSRD
jgi:hypothetical protein